MDKISIIIPVYNVEPYIRKCLDSVLNQTYTNLEMLLINDGSTDNSGIICNDYAAKDSRIRVFHKANGGVSSAKNVGLKHMTGKYVGFVDSDDWIEPDMYEILHTAIRDSNADISIASYFKDTDNTSVAMTNMKQIPNRVINIKEMLLYPLQRDYYMGFCGYLWNKLFSADVFLKNNLQFDENINYAEDLLLYTRAVTEGDCKGFYVDKPLYHYRQRPESIAHSKSVNVKTDLLKAYKKVEQIFTQKGYSDIGYWARGFYCYHASVIAEIALKNNDKKTLDLMQIEIKTHLEDYIKTNEEFPEKYSRMYKLLEVEL